mgnify:CR=1 FL=1
MGERAGGGSVMIEAGPAGGGQGWWGGAGRGISAEQEANQLVGRGIMVVVGGEEIR